MVAKLRQNQQDNINLELGSLVYIRYKDHVLFKDVKSESCNPVIRETIGWVDYEDDDYIRIVWERYSQPYISVEASIRSTGLVILKKAILEVKPLA